MFDYVLVSMQKQQFFEKIFCDAKQKQICQMRIFPAEYSKRKYFCHLFLYFTSIVELHTKFICDEIVKIKFAQLPESCFSIYPHTRLSHMREFNLKKNKVYFISISLLFTIYYLYCRFCNFIWTYSTKHVRYWNWRQKNLVSEILAE